MYMNGAAPVAVANTRIAPKIRRIRRNGIKNHILFFHKNPINSPDSLTFPTGNYYVRANLLLQPQNFPELENPDLKSGMC